MLGPCWRGFVLHRGCTRRPETRPVVAIAKRPSRARLGQICWSVRSSAKTTGSFALLGTTDTIDAIATFDATDAFATIATTAAIDALATIDAFDTLDAIDTLDRIDLTTVCLFSFHTFATRALDHAGA